MTFAYPTQTRLERTNLLFILLKSALKCSKINKNRRFPKGVTSTLTSTWSAEFICPRSRNRTDEFWLDERRCRFLTRKRIRENHSKTFYYFAGVLGVKTIFQYKIYTLINIFKSCDKLMGLSENGRDQINPTRNSEATARDFANAPRS